LHHIEKLKKAIKEQQVLEIDYQPFNKDLLILHIHPYLLKEYNNRWFVFCYTNEYKGKGVYALDRILNIRKTDLKYKSISVKTIQNYFKDILGCTNIKENKVEKIVVRLKNFRANYLISKPNHHSQKVLKKDDQYTWFSFNLKINPELTAYLLSFGPDLKVEEPKVLVDEMKKLLSGTLSNY
jgi:predicted DNA-binding transcriptional regulator YafY